MRLFGRIARCQMPHVTFYSESVPGPKNSATRCRLLVNLLCFIVNEFTFRPAITPTISAPTDDERPEICEKQSLP